MTDIDAKDVPARISELERQISTARYNQDFVTIGRCQAEIDDLHRRFPGVKSANPFEQMFGSMGDFGGTAFEDILKNSPLFGGKGKG